MSTKKEIARTARNFRSVLNFIDSLKFTKALMKNDMKRFSEVLVNAGVSVSTEILGIEENGECFGLETFSKNKHSFTLEFDSTGFSLQPVTKR